MFRNIETFGDKKPMKVKLFNDANAEQLENRVNVFLYNIQFDNIKDIKFTRGEFHWGVMIIYE